ncbi:exopolyphosphatase-like enzyme [Halovivax ruber XH-70]|uniref:Exopolyphosphatase-like enzyme n=1 Tax=Halovivax ruber (strain DSM 18193 / JCM 13892 / XH-70) TaxID=797302 RepID=L0ICX3_HALRX|nr:bifunctional oligoribonuclease/PAP phosphatase NrnA [Halovivax ruber]AGB16081.1 exopolyphosphatase-like enzyme [Halovivax ruber XH-70]
MSRAETLAAMLVDESTVTIVCHDNPDPDCLASALAFEHIARSRDVPSSRIVYGGEISHQQNRAFVNMLDITVDHDGEVDSDGFVVFVDHARHSVSTVDAGIEPDAIVDHHPAPDVDAPFVDIRPTYGATATIFVEYLQALEIQLTRRLATALLFALHRERLDFVREPTRAEYEAALAVYDDADLDSLEQLYGSAFTPATIDAIGEAIRSRSRRGSALVANVGRTPETDALPQAADYLLNVEGVNTVLAYGIVGEAIRLSARSIDPRVNVGRTLNQAFDPLGTAGGHHDMAGGHIDLGIFSDYADDDDCETLISMLSPRIEHRFFEALRLAPT